MVPKIWSATDKFFCHFGLLFALYSPLITQKIKILKKKIPIDIITLHMCTIKANHIMYGSWDMEHDGQKFLSFWTVFCPFTSITTWKIKILKKWKKSPRDIIILNICTINDNHMMYVSWDIEGDGQNFLSFGPFFALLPPNNPKNQNFAKMEITPGDIIILHKCAINDNHMMCGSWDMKHWRTEFFVVFDRLPH